MQTIPIPFTPFFALADSAAETFARHRTSAHLTAGTVARQIIRGQSVDALRYLWRSSAPEGRTILACRVAAWMGRPVNTIADRVRAREQARGGAR